MNASNSSEQYYFSENNVVHGPFVLNELIDKINADTLIFKEDGTKWERADEVPEIITLLSEKKAALSSNENQVSNPEITQNTNSDKVNKEERSDAHSNEKYSDKELEEFKEIILKKISAAKTELDYLNNLIISKEETDVLDNGILSDKSEEASGIDSNQIKQMIDRQNQYIEHLGKAMKRIEDKTYGVCKVSGKLIDKERLKNFPIATIASDVKKEYDIEVSTNDHDVSSLNIAAKESINEIPLQSNEEPKKSIAKFAFGLLLTTLAVLFYFYWLAPFLKDRNAPRKYCFIESLVVRSSKVAGVEYNVIDNCSYGDEVIVYEDDGEWSTCKFNNQVCYIASQFLLPYKDFHLLHSIFADNVSREAVLTSKCRLALLDYFKQNNYVGILDQQLNNELFGNNSDSVKEVWQLFARDKDYKLNNVYYERVINSNSTFTDFACVLSKFNSNERKFLLFSFSDDETPNLEYEEYAPTNGYIKRVYLDNRYGSMNFYVKYTD